MREYTNLFNKTYQSVIGNIQQRSQDHLDIDAFVGWGQKITYRTFFEYKDIYARAFLSIGVKEGDIVTICTAGTLDTVLYFAGLNAIGAVAQFVNPNYFKVNSKKYINETGSRLVIVLDRFYKILEEAIEATSVEIVLLASISEYSSLFFRLLVGKRRISVSNKGSDTRYIRFDDFIKEGIHSNEKVISLPYIKNRNAVIAYTSGSTGNPKGVVHTNDSINNMMTMYELADGFGVKAGDRNMILIPPMYLTSLIHSIYAPMSLGTTNILQPIYNPNTFGRDLRKYRPRSVVASKTHYTNLRDSKLPQGSLDFVKFPYCGGEAITRNAAMKINEILKHYGMPPVIIGYGQTEFGTMVLFSNDIPDRTNEAGVLLPGIKAKIVDPITGDEVSRGKYGELLIDSPAVMRGYFNNEEATDTFFRYADNESRWADTGDIAGIVRDYDGHDVYDVVGRRTDSFIDEKGQMIYLFKIEMLTEEVDGVREAEVVSLSIGGRKVPVVHIVPEASHTQKIAALIRRIDEYLKGKTDNSSEIPYAYKVRTSFDISPISGKRDYDTLKYETDGYVRINDSGDIEDIKIASDDSKIPNEIEEVKKLKIKL